MRALGLLLVLVACGGSTEPDASPSRKSCVRLRDHVIDVRLSSAAGIDREAHRKALEQSLGDEFLRTCKDTLTTSQVRCALDTRDPDAISRCRTQVTIQ